MLLAVQTAKNVRCPTTRLPKHWQSQWHNSATPCSGKHRIRYARPSTDERLPVGGCSNALARTSHSDQADHAQEDQRSRFGNGYPVSTGDIRRESNAVEAGVVDNPKRGLNRRLRDEYGRSERAVVKLENFVTRPLDQIEIAVAVERDSPIKVRVGSGRCGIQRGCGQKRGDRSRRRDTQDLH